MPQVSKIKLSKKTEQELVESLNLVFASITKREEMIAFLNALFTDTEKLMLAKRLATVMLIKENIPDSHIASILHITRMTVAKLKYYYEARAKEGFDIALAKIASDKQLKTFKKLLISLAKYAVRAAGGYVKPTVFD